MTHALDAARALNDAAGGTSWETDVAAHLLNHGHFLAAADCVLLWRPVSRHWSEDDLCNPWKADPDGNAWYLWCAVGNLHRFTAMAASGGWPVKEWVAFHRRGIPKWYRLETLIRRIDGKKTKQQRRPEGTEGGERSKPKEL